MVEYAAEDFKRLNQNYQDYLRDFYSGKSEQLMKSVEFVVHKDKFVKYLTEFIQEMQRHSHRIEQSLLKNIPLMEEKNSGKSSTKRTGYSPCTS